jgi:hypothetical protein
MPTGLIMAINASQLISQTASEAARHHLKPAHFVNPHAFIGGVTNQHLRPAHFANPHTLNGATVVSDSAGAHLYWQVQVLDNNGSGFTSIGCKLVMFLSSDGSGTNLVSGGTLTGSAPGVFGNDLANLLDGLDGSQWAVNETGNDFVTYQFASAVGPHSITMKVVSGQEALMPSHFKIRWSNDGVSFTTALDVTGENWLSGAGERVYSF